MTLPERLIKLRKAAGLSQEEVADKLELTRQTVSKWETGQSSPDLDKVLPLCNLYGVTPDELLHDGGSDEADELKAQRDAERAEELLDKSVAKKKTIGILVAVAIPVAGINPIIAGAIFLLLCGLATLIIIFSAITYRRNHKENKPRSKGESLYRSIDGILALVTLTFYLLVSFLTGAWYITWIMWIIYAVLTQIVKLIFLIKTGEDYDDED